MLKSLKTLDYMSLLPEHTTATISKLEFLARAKMNGSITGRHVSPHKGFSVEFAEHRQYSKGDDLRNLDWRAYAKADRYYIKQYIEETNLRAMVLLDCSGSMNYRGTMGMELDGKRLSKFEYGRYLAAALSYLLIRQQDAVGLVTFDDEIREYVKAMCRKTQVRTILERLHATKTGTDTSLSATLHEIAERIPQRGLVLIISDLFDDVDSIIEGLHHLAFRGHEVVIFHTMAEEELTFPFKKFSNFRNLENADHKLKIDPRSVKADYLEKVRSFIRTLEVGCGQMQADYVPFTTSRPFDRALADYVTRRSRRS